MVEITLPIILQLLQTAGILVGIFYYIMTIRTNQRNQELILRAQEQALETRQAQMFMQVFQEDITKKGPHVIMDLLEWDFENADDFDAKYGKDTNPEAYQSYIYWLYYMEGMGIMVREGYISIRLIALMDSGGVKNLWRKLQPLIYEERERHNWPRWSIEFEYLYDTLMDYAEKHPELQI
jgi:hypothetical protein